MQEGRKAVFVGFAAALGHKGIKFHDDLVLNRLKSTCLLMCFWDPFTHLGESWKLHGDEVIEMPLWQVGLGSGNILFFPRE